MTVPPGTMRLEEFVFNGIVVVKVVLQCRTSSASHAYQSGGRGGDPYAAGGRMTASSNITKVPQKGKAPFFLLENNPIFASNCCFFMCRTALFIFTKN